MVDLVSHWNQEMQAMLKGKVTGGEEIEEEVPHAEVIQPINLVEDEENIEGEEKLPKKDNLVACKEEVMMEPDDEILKTVKSEADLGDFVKCKRCDFKCTSRESLRKHRDNIHKVVKISYCDQCDYKCTKKQLVLDHIERAHSDGTVKSEADALKCNRCDYICTSREALRKHRNNIHKVVKTSYCNQCDYKCTKKQLVLDHIERTHSDGTETETRTCHKCNFSCNTIRAMNFHKYKMHKNKKIFYCKDCDYKCVKRDLLNVHKEKEHGHKLEPEIRNCKKCKFVCTTFTELRTHRDKTHRVAQLYYCDECDYKVTKKEVLLDHIDKHSDPAEIETRRCDLCDYTTQSRVSLRMHKNIKHLGQAKRCSECNFTAYRKYTIALHEAKKHGKEMPEKNVLCHLCDYRTGDSSNLRTHNAAKHDGQMYFCDQCEFKSSYKGSLPHHKKIHDEETWVQCEHCSYRCASIYNLQTHMEGKHNDISMTSYPCNQCDASRRTKTDLRSHVRSKHGGVGIPKRKCGACDYKTISSTNLKKHFTARHTNYRFEIFYLSHMRYYQQYFL